MAIRVAAAVVVVSHICRWSVLVLLGVMCVLLAVVVGILFFFKQKTAYEGLRSLVGSEMCIRDSSRAMGGVKRVRAAFLQRP